MLCYTKLYYTILYYTILYYTPILDLDDTGVARLDEVVQLGDELLLYVCMYIYIYIYIYIHTYVREIYI